MEKHTITFFPVDNGDTTAIKLKDGTTVIIDCRIREAGGKTNSEDQTIYDVKAGLLDILEKEDKHPFTDLFINTHADWDHLTGIKKHFYLGKPDDYDDDDLEAELIVIKELWVTPMVFDDVNNDDAKALKKEAERRKKLWDDDSPERNKGGNLIRIIGYNGEKRFEKVPYGIPGETLTEINGSSFDYFEFFVHSPFKKSLISASAETDHNFSSIVMQARFKMNSKDTEYSCFFLFGGDADHNIWKEIHDKSEKNDNLDKLEWDIFMTPHHCSWTYFNDVPYNNKEENKTPKATSLEILDLQRDNSKIIASCKLIRDNDDNPPHYKAKKEYLKKVTNSEDFIELANYHDKDKPLPVVFEISTSGTTLIEKKKLSAEAKSFFIGTAQTAQRPYCDDWRSTCI